MPSPSLNKKPLFAQRPADDADVAEWRHWANQLYEWANKIAEDEKKRRKKLKLLRQELDKKNDVLLHYKQRISELEEPGPSIFELISTTVKRTLNNLIQRGRRIES